MTKCNSIPKLLGLALVALVLAPGCARWRLPAIDPSGEHIFLPSPSYTSWDLGPTEPLFPRLPRPLFETPPDAPECYVPLSSPPSARSIFWPSAESGYGQPGYVNPTYSDPCAEWPQAAYAQYQSPYVFDENTPCIPGYEYPVPCPGEAAAVAPVSPYVAPQAIPQPAPPSIVSPTTLPPFATPTAPAPGPLLTHSGRSRSPYRDEYAAKVIVTPDRIVAPVGSEVVVRAGMCGSDGYLITRQPIEWSLTQDSVGSIVEVDETEQSFWRHMFHKPPKKQNGGYAIGRTSTERQVLTRGTVDPNDDIWVLEGQTWLSVTSASEGATHVTAVAPTAAGWTDRRGTSTIYWVDGQWTFPPPAISGSTSGQTLTTNVRRTSTGVPVTNWLARYEIVGGTPAQLGPNGEQALEVPTDTAGNASVMLTPTGAFAGPTQVRMQLIRTGSTPGDLPRYVVGESITSVQWTDTIPSTPPPQIPPIDTPPTLPPTTPPPTAQQPIAIRVTGPDTAEPGSTATYRIDIANPNNVTAQGVEVTYGVPTGLTYRSSQPTGDSLGENVRWLVGDLGPGQVRSFSVDVAIPPGWQTGNGQFQTCAAVTTATGETSQDCAVTRLAASPADALRIDVNGPETAAVGQEAHYQITVTNQSAFPVTNAIIKDRFDVGLGHPQGGDERLIEQPLGTLQPGESRQLGLTFVVQQPGQLCHVIEVTSGSGSTARREVCVNATGQVTTPPPDYQPPTTPITPPAGPVAALEVTGQGPQPLSVGESGMFRFLIRNVSTQPLTNLSVQVQLAPELEPTNATPGVARGGPSGEDLVWNYDQMGPGQFGDLQIEVRALQEAGSACCTLRVTSAEAERGESTECVVIQGSPTPATPGTPQYLPADPGGLRGQVRPDEFSPVPNGGAAAPRPRVPTARVPTARVPTESATNGNVLAAAVQRPAVTEPAATIPAGDGLSVTVSDLGDPATVNKRLTYVIVVHNSGSEPDRDVVLQVELPEQTKYVSSINPPLIRARSASPNGRRIEFLPIAELRPDETAIFRLVVNPQVPGTGSLTASVTSQRSPRPVVTAESTHFYASGG
ncbi:MAG: DUF11 domain-containing protein [Planctomycetales bacterium]|nr:DUF11 domain-containing protein [Planctomycetales bacterium]